MTQKVTVEKQELYAALQKLMKVIPSTTNLMALNYVHLSMDNDELVLRGTDLDVSLVVRVKAQGNIDDTCVLAKALYVLAKPESKKDRTSVVIECSGKERVGINVDSMTTVIQSFPVEDYPELPKVRLKFAVKSWNGGELKKLLSYVIPAMSDDETRSHINCAAFLDKKIVTTDGHRLHTAVLPSAVKEDVLLPARAVYLCDRFLNKKQSVSIKINKDKNRVLVESENWELYSKFSQGEFPPHDQVVPKGNEVHVEIETKVLSKVLKKLNGLASFLKLSLDGGQCKLLTEDTEFGSTETELSVKQLNGSANPLLVGFTISYLMDVINFDFEKAVLKLGGPLDAALVEAGAVRQSVVMPMRI